MTAARVAYLNARLIDPESGLDQAGALLTEGDRIVALGPEIFPAGPPADAEVVHCGGRVLCPGLIDMRVFTGEPGAEHKETLATAGQSAAVGGVTTRVVMPNTDPVIDDVALVGFMERLGQRAQVHVHPMAALTKGLRGEAMCELGLLAEAGAVGFTDGDRAVTDAGLMRRALSYASAFGLLVCQFPREPSLSAEAAMNEGEMATRLGLPGVPPMAETIVVERDLRLVEITGGRYHVAALSTARAAAAVAEAKARDLPVTAAVCLHNMALNENAVGDYRTFAKTEPPLRAEHDRQAIAQAIADGTIDVICSGHDPQDPESKRQPFEVAASGIVGLEALLPLSLELYHNGLLKLPDLLAKLTCNPARLLGLDAGRLREGAPADLLVFDLDEPWRLDVEAFRSKSKNAPYDGRPVQGRAWRTIVNGHQVYDRHREMC
ncbi:MAG: dihydroorotase [Alphaproteobacteria bacterium]